MPVTAKLSRKFYEAFGDEIANELVDWFNQVRRYLQVRSSRVERAQLRPVRDETRS